MIENPMKGKRGHVCGIPLVCPLVSPGFTKQTGNGRVRLSLVRPSSSRTPCARTYVCAANMRMRRGRYASSRERCLRTYACMSMRWQNTRRAHVPTMSSIWCSSSPAWVVPGPGPGPGARARAHGGEQMGASHCALMSILFDSPVLVMR